MIFGALISKAFNSDISSTIGGVIFLCLGIREIYSCFISSSDDENSKSGNKDIDDHTAKNKTLDLEVVDLPTEVAIECTPTTTTSCNDCNIDITRNKSARTLTTDPNNLYSCNPSSNIESQDADRFDEDESNSKNVIGKNKIKY